MITREHENSGGDADIQPDTMKMERFLLLTFVCRESSLGHKETILPSSRLTDSSFGPLAASKNLDRDAGLGKHVVRHWYG